MCKTFLCASEKNKKRMDMHVSSALNKSSKIFTGCEIVPDTYIRTELQGLFNTRYDKMTKWHYTVSSLCKIWESGRVNPSSLKAES